MGAKDEMGLKSAGCEDDCCGGCVDMSDKGVGPEQWQVGGRNEMLDGSDDWLVGAYDGC